MIISKVYINGIYQGETDGLTWSLGTIYTSPPTPFGEGYSGLHWGETYLWRIDTFDDATNLTTVGDTWAFTVQIPWPFVPNPSDPGMRGSDYNPDDVYDWSDGTWKYDVGILVAGGGRYQTTMIAISQDGHVFYEAI